MSATYYYRVRKLEKDLCFSGGTSNDLDALDKVFNRVVSTEHISTLRAMDAALGRQTSLWGEIADKLEAIRGQTGQEVTLEIWPEY